MLGIKLSWVWGLGSATDHGSDNWVRLWAGRTLLYGPALPVFPSGGNSSTSVLSLPVPRNETSDGELEFRCDTVGSPMLEGWAKRW